MTEDAAVDRWREIETVDLLPHQCSRIVRGPVFQKKACEDCGWMFRPQYPETKHCALCRKGSQCTW